MTIIANRLADRSQPVSPPPTEVAAGRFDLDVVSAFAEASADRRSLAEARQPDPDGPPKDGHDK